MIDSAKISHLELFNRLWTVGAQSLAMSSFFTLPASQRKRKRNDATGEDSTKRRTTDPTASRDPRKPKSAPPKRDESISGSGSEDEEPSRKVSEDEDGSDGSSESDQGDETGAERRLRLAERYLENIKGEVDEAGFDAEEIDRDLIAERLKEDVVRQ